MAAPAVPKAETVVLLEAPAGEFCDFPILVTGRDGTRLHDGQGVVLATGPFTVTVTSLLTDTAKTFNDRDARRLRARLGDPDDRAGGSGSGGDRPEVNFLRPVYPDGRDLVARGRVRHVGRTVSVAEAELLNADGKPVALATGSAMILADRPAALADRD